MADLVRVELGAVQETLFIPLAARARETRRRRPLLRDPKAAEILASVDYGTKKYGRGWGGGVTVLRTAIFDCGSATSSRSIQAGRSWRSAPG